MMSSKRFLGFILTALIFTGCESGSTQAPTDTGLSAVPDLSSGGPGSAARQKWTPTPTPSTQPSPKPSPTPTATPSPSPSGGTRTTVLLFNGTGVSTSDWQTTEQIVQSMGLSYKLADSASLSAMTLDELASYRLMIVPGGNGITITDNLSAQTRLKVRQAVRDRGVSYVGFCAGAWVAVGPDANTNNLSSYGFQVAPGAILTEYFPGGNTSVVAEIVPIRFSNGSQRQMMWWGGPETPEWAHGVIGRYDNGTAAISETPSGQGYVVISGVHPEAPASWQETSGVDPDGLDQDIAITMIQAALNRAPMATY